MSFFSIVIPTYNRADLLRDTLVSIQNQSFEDFEVIIVDDGGKDHTEQVVAELNDTRFKYHWKENGERARARNYGIRKSTGKYISFHDSDDILYPNHLHIVYEFIRNNPKAKFIATGRQNIDENGAQILGSTTPNPVRPNDSLIYGNYLSCLGVFIISGLLKENRFLEDDDLLLSEDWHLWLRIAARVKLYYIPETTCALRVHDARSVLAVDVQKQIKRQTVLMESLKADQIFMQKYGNQWPGFEAHNYTYIALHVLLGKPKYRSVALQHLWKAIKLYPPTLFKRRTLAILKHFI